MMELCYDETCTKRHDPDDANALCDLFTGALGLKHITVPCEGKVYVTIEDDIKIYDCRSKSVPGELFCSFHKSIDDQYSQVMEESL